MNTPLLTRKQEIVERFGAWTAHNIHLGDGVYTIGERVVGDEIKLRRIVQIVTDLVGRPLSELRLLDLAFLEGLYAIEFARHGAEVLGIEGREVNVAKAHFAQEALGLDRLTLLQDDVRNLGVEKHGRFDVVLCLGILYHLNHPDVFAFLERIGEVCLPGGIAVIDTHVSLRPWVSRSYGGERYWGRSFVEHSPFSSPEKRLEALWASLDNTSSFWPTRPSLVNALGRAGFSSVYECFAPAEPGKISNRITLVAVKGTTRDLVSTPQVNEHEPAELPEKFSWWQRLLGAGTRVKKAG